jgi:hypothetical protein
VEEIEVLHVLLDLNYWQINKHTSYFWSVLADQLSNKFENGTTDSLFVSGVHFINCTNDWDGNSVEASS